VIIYSLSTDGENPIDILAINAASAALMVSDIPWAGPIAAVRVGKIDGEFVVNPTFEQQESSTLDLRLAGSRDAILMVECGAKELSEEDMVQALDFGHRSIQPLIDLQEQMAAEVISQTPVFALPDKPGNLELCSRQGGSAAGCPPRPALR
jgi:polyribonucleotide nucleotidyltransferase